jgi:hypothetical protein
MILLSQIALEFVYIHVSRKPAQLSAEDCMIKHRTPANSIPVLLAAGLLTLPYQASQPGAWIKCLDGTIASGSELHSVLDSALAIPGIAALSVAVVRDGRTKQPDYSSRLGPM